MVKQGKPVGYWQTLQAARSLPVGRTGTANDIAQAIVDLLGNGFTTGAMLDIDGGARMAG